MNKIEILAPAGGPDSVIAAVHSGADAIYVGSKRFSARAAAQNFDDDELRECIRYCHVRGVKVYLALNTLIFDDEMEAALELAKDAARMDVDALIVQDIGLATLIHKAIPGLPLHASTQMSVHTEGGARMLYDMGLKRVVLSRELSIDEIEAINDRFPEIELEVFVDGALCYCMSGQCYFSAMLGGRSANRGRCAQPCRLPMRYGDNDHALSLKDNGGTPYIKELECIGVASAKIEGRLKRPEYVATAVANAVQRRESRAYARSSCRRHSTAFCADHETDGYLCGMLGRDMFGTRKKDEKTDFNKIYKEIRQGYKDEPDMVPIDVRLEIRVGEKARLTATVGSDSVTVESEKPVEKAEKNPTSLDAITNSICKTGGTPYYIRKQDMSCGDDAFIPVSSLNAMRRQALQKLDELRSKPRHNYTINDFDIYDELEDGSQSYEETSWFCSPDLEIPQELKGKGVVFVPLEGLTDTDKVRGMVEDGWRIGIEMPRAIFSGELHGPLYSVFEELIVSCGVIDIMSHTLDTAYDPVAEGCIANHAGFGMNLANSWSLKWAKDNGFADAEVSVELTLRQIERLRKCIPVGIIRYGHFPLMVSRNAPNGANDTCKNGDFLQDRKGESFPIRRHEEYFEILNCVPILMPRKDYPMGGGVFDIIRFTVENSVENKENILEKLRRNAGFERFTHGMYIRGVK